MAGPFWCPMKGSSPKDGWFFGEIVAKNDDFWSVPPPPFSETEHTDDPVPEDFQRAKPGQGGKKSRRGGYQRC